MSLSQLKVADLRAVAEYFAVDVEKGASRNEILSRLEEEGVTNEQYKKFLGQEEEVETQEVAAAETSEEPASGVFNRNTLVKMERRNRTFEVLGYKFTQQSPYNLMSEDEAQKIMDMFDGFRIATPKEAKEFYA